MHSGNPTSQIMNSDINKTSLLHHPFEGFTIREFQDGIRQILVSAALREQTTQPGQYP